MLRLMVIWLYNTLRKESTMKIKKLTASAITPTLASVGSAGYDLYADSVDDAVNIIMEDGTVYVADGTTVTVHTGIAMAIPEGYVGLLFARSGLACKQGLRPANCVGVIDADYRGEVIVKLHSDPDFTKFYDSNNEIKGDELTSSFASFKLGDRIAQIVFVKYDTFALEEVDELDETARGKGGFGTSDNKNGSY